MGAHSEQWSRKFQRVIIKNILCYNNNLEIIPASLWQANYEGFSSFPQFSSWQEAVCSLHFATSNEFGSGKLHPCSACSWNQQGNNIWFWLGDLFYFGDCLNWMWTGSAPPSAGRGAGALQTHGKLPKNVPVVVLPPFWNQHHLSRRWQWINKVMQQYRLRRVEAQLVYFTPKDVF